MISKETFVNAINAIENQMKLDIALNDALDKYGDGNNLLLAGKLIDSLMAVLNGVMGCKSCGAVGTDIEFFCFEHEFGRRNSSFVVLPRRGRKAKEIWIKSAEELYDYLKENK